MQHARMGGVTCGTGPLHVPPGWCSPPFPRPDHHLVACHALPGVQLWHRAVSTSLRDGWDGRRKGLDCNDSFCACAPLPLQPLRCCCTNLRPHRPTVAHCMPPAPHPCACSWELLTGRIPYSDMTPLQAAVGVVQKGLRPPIPPNCPPPLSDIMRLCWQRDPNVRPSFEQVHCPGRGVVLSRVGRGCCGRRRSLCSCGMFLLGHCAVYTTLLDLFPTCHASLFTAHTLCSLRSSR